MAPDTVMHPAAFFFPLPTPAPDCLEGISQFHYVGIAG